jgi:hypothetical protein
VRVKLPDWQRKRIASKLETGGAIVAMRQRGHRWDDLVAAFNLGDSREAKRLAVHYLLASSVRPPESAQDASSDEPPAQAADDASA